MPGKQGLHGAFHQKAWIMTMSFENILVLVSCKQAELLARQLLGTLVGTLKVYGGPLTLITNGS